MFLVSGNDQLSQIVGSYRRKIFSARK